MIYSCVDDRWMWIQDDVIYKIAFIHQEAGYLRGRWMHSPDGDVTPSRIHPSHGASYKAWALQSRWMIIQEMSIHQYIIHCSVANEQLGWLSKGKFHLLRHGWMPTLLSTVHLHLDDFLDSHPPSLESTLVNKPARQTREGPAIVPRKSAKWGGFYYLVIFNYHFDKLL